MAKAKAVDSNLYGERPDYSGGMPDDRERELSRALNWLNYHTDASSLAKYTNQYLEKTLSKSDYASYKKAPQSLISFTTHKLIYMTAAGWELNEREQKVVDRVVNDMIARGKKIKTKVETTNVVVLSPAERLRNKVCDTILADLDAWEDAIIDGQGYDLDVFTKMKEHDLKGSVPTHMVNTWIQDRLDEINCALNKEDEQCVEAYSHMTKKSLTTRKKQLETMLQASNSFGLSVKATKAPRKKKPKAATSQVSKVKYQKESSEYQISSIDPSNIPGAFRLFVFNTKNRELTEYVTYRREGFEVSGTSIKHFDEEGSRKVKLRKPEDLLPLVLTKTPKQVDNAWKKLTTKSSKPTGRLNEDCVLLRALDK